MIQFNLLPDVKIDFIKTRYRKRLIAFVSIVAAASTLTIFILLFLYVRVAQKAQMNSLSKEIQTHLSTIQQTPDLDKILTIQNQLNSMPDLHNKRVVTSRLVDYLGQLTPAQATISEVQMSFPESKLTIKGNADSLGTVNKFTDTLKFTDYKVNEEQPKEGKAFSSVVLQSFSLNLASADQRVGAASYEISFTFDAAIFASISRQLPPEIPAVQLVVPKIISTRSETEKPGNLFVPQPIQTPQTTPPAGTGR